MRVTGAAGSRVAKSGSRGAPDGANRYASPWPTVGSENASLPVEPIRTADLPRSGGEATQERREVRRGNVPACALGRRARAGEGLDGCALTRWRASDGLAAEHLPRARDHEARLPRIGDSLEDAPPAAERIGAALDHDALLFSHAQRELGAVGVDGLPSTRERRREAPDDDADVAHERHLLGGPRARALLAPIVRVPLHRGRSSASAPQTFPKALSGGRHGRSGAQRPPRQRANGAYIRVRRLRPPSRLDLRGLHGPLAPFGRFGLHDCRSSDGA